MRKNGDQAVNIRFMKTLQRLYPEPFAGSKDLGDGTDLYVFDEERDMPKGRGPYRIYRREDRRYDRAWEIVADLKSGEVLKSHTGPKVQRENPDFSRINVGTGKVPAFAKACLGNDVAEKFSTVRDLEKHMDANGLYVPTRAELRNKSLPNAGPAARKFDAQREMEAGNYNITAFAAEGTFTSEVEGR